MFFFYTSLSTSLVYISLSLIIWSLQPSDPWRPLKSLIPGMSSLAIVNRPGSLCFFGGKLILAFVLGNGGSLRGEGVYPLNLLSLKKKLAKLRKHAS